LGIISRDKKEGRKQKQPKENGAFHGVLCGTQSWLSVPTLHLAGSSQTLLNASLQELLDAATVEEGAMVSGGAIGSTCIFCGSSHPFGGLWA